MAGVYGVWGGGDPDQRSLLSLFLVMVMLLVVLLILELLALGRGLTLLEFV